MKEEKLINRMTPEELVKDYISYHYIEGNISNEQRVKMTFEAKKYIELLSELKGTAQ